MYFPVINYQNFTGTTPEWASPKQVDLRVRQGPDLFSLQRLATPDVPRAHPRALYQVCRGASRFL